MDGSDAWKGGDNPITRDLKCNSLVPGLAEAESREKPHHKEDENGYGDRGEKSDTSNFEDRED